MVEDTTSEPITETPEPAPSDKDVASKAKAVKKDEFGEIIEGVPHAQRDKYTWDDEKGWVAPKQ